VAGLGIVRLTPVRQQAVSVSLATGAYGLSLGALAIAAGLDLWQTMALSLIVFSGGSQFAFVGVIGAGGAPLAGVVTSAFLGVRNGIYGLTLAPILRPMHGVKRAWAAQVTIDESTAVALAQPASDPDARREGFWWTGVGVFIAWNVAVLAGTFIGSSIGDPSTWGLDAAAGAAFLGLVWPRLASRGARLVALSAAVLALALTPVMPAGIPILSAALVAVVAGWREPSARDNPSPQGEMPA